MSDTPQGEGWWQASDGRWYAPQQGGAVPPPPGPAVPPGPGPSVGSSTTDTTTMLLLAAGGALFLSLVGALVLGLDNDFFSSVKLELARWIRDLGLLAAAVIAVVVLLPRFLNTSDEDDS